MAKCGCLVKSRFVEASSATYSGYIDYIDRENAVRNNNIDKFSDYCNYMGNPDKTSSLFDSAHDILSYQKKKSAKDLYCLAQQKGSLMWQTVISFDNDWLRKNAIINDFGELNEKALKEYTRNAVSSMLKNEKLESAYWTAAFHYNTDNIHIHIATVDPNLTREKIRKTVFKLPADWVKENLITDNIQFDKNISVYSQETTAAEKALFKSLKKALPECKLGSSYKINKDNSIEVYVKSGIETCPPFAEVIRDGEIYKGTFEDKSRRKCRSRMVNQIIEKSVVNEKINNLVRNIIGESLKNNVLWNNREFADQYLKVYNMLPNDKRQWKYEMNALKSVRDEINKLTDLFVSKNHLETFNELRRLLKQQEKQYISAYGGKTKDDYYKNKINDLYTRYGNIILENMKDLSNSSLLAAQPNVSAIERENFEQTESFYLAQTIYDITDEEIFDIPDDDFYTEWSDAYKKAKSYMYDSPPAEKANLPLAEKLLLNESSLGNAYALFDLGKVNAMLGKKDLAQNYYSKALTGFKNQFSHSVKRKEKEYLSYRIGKLYMTGLTGKVNYNKAFEYLSSSGLPYAKYSLSHLYENGLGTEQNHHTAVSLLKQAAANTLIMPFASYKLAKHYKNGLGVESDYKISVSYFEKAYLHFNEKDFTDIKALCAYNAGKLYLTGGINLEQNIYAGLKYLTAAAELNSPYASYALAVVYKTGDLIAEDSAYAVKMLEHTISVCDEKSSDHNQNGKFEHNTNKFKYIAYYQLGNIYLQGGNNVVQDSFKAVSYYKEAADNGNQYAQYQLGRLYLFGNQDIAADKDMANFYLRSSAEQGNEYAKALLEYKPNIGIYGKAHDYNKTPALSSSVESLIQRLAREDREHQKNMRAYALLSKKEQEKKNEDLDY